MKAIVLAALTLVACDPAKAPDAPTTSATATPTPTTPSTPATTSAPSSPSSSSAPPKRPLAKEGEMCGGLAGIMCADGLSCRYGAKPIPDAPGTCTK